MKGCGFSGTGAQQQFFSGDNQMCNSSHASGIRFPLSSLHGSEEE